MKIFRVCIEWFDGTKTNLKPGTNIWAGGGAPLQLEEVEDYVRRGGNSWLKWETLYTWEDDAEAEEWAKEKQEDIPGYTILRVSRIAAVHVLYEKP